MILGAAFLCVTGCGDSTAQNSPTASKLDSATYVRPVERKIEDISMKDFSTKSGLKIFPGSESASGESFSHGEGITKNVITFSTSDSVEKIAEFYKGEGMDIRNKMMPIGATKSGAQVMVTISAGKDGKNDVKITGLLEPPKTP